VEDNFFELGRALVTGVDAQGAYPQGYRRRAFGESADAQPEVAGQVACVNGQAGNSLIVRLNSQTRGTPLYLFHPSYGSVHCYKAIALALREQRPVMGVICRAFGRGGQ